jgi:hypothetical protein
MIDDPDEKKFHFATMRNFSDNGMYCESDHPIRLGALIRIRLDNLPFKSAPKLYLGQICRCEELNRVDKSHFYGLGIKTIEGIYEWT